MEVSGFRSLPPKLQKLHTPAAAAWPSRERAALRSAMGCFVACHRNYLTETTGATRNRVPFEACS